MMVQGHTNGDLGNESWSGIGVGPMNRTSIQSLELCYMKFVGKVMTVEALVGGIQAQAIVLEPMKLLVFRRHT